MADEDLNWLRRQFITALAADDELFEQLVLKGGNALSLVHQIGHRASLDLDYSMEGDAEDAAELGRRIFSALKARLEPREFVVFDEKFGPRPSKPTVRCNPKWGGYNAEFKLISRERFDEFGGDIEKIRKVSVAVGSAEHSGRKFRIEISNFEFCVARTDKEVEDGFSCQVYTLALIAVEKLRSLCQQMDEYGMRAHPTPRARDFYDLHALITEGGVELSGDEVHGLARGVFSAKEAGLPLLGLLENYREFHRSDWPAVVNAIPGSKHQDFDFYVDFVLSEVRKLKPLWVVDTP